MATIRPTATLVPTLTGQKGHPMHHGAVTDVLGGHLITGMNAQDPTVGTDYLRFTLVGAPQQHGQGAQLLTIKLTLEGTFTVERGHIDLTTSVRTYAADQQVVGLALDQVHDVAEAMFTSLLLGELAELADLADLDDAA